MLIFSKLCLMLLVRLCSRMILSSARRTKLERFEVKRVKMIIFLSF